MLLTYTRLMVIFRDPLPQPPGELAYVSLAGYVLHKVFDGAGHLFQQLPSLLYTAAAGLGPGL